MTYPCDGCDGLGRVVVANRAAAVKTHCPQGHPYDEANTYVRPGTVHRKCRTCARDRDLRRAGTRNAKRRAARKAA